MRNRPIPSSPYISRFMSRLPRRDTGPEVALRRALHAGGVRFRIHANLPGRPDIVLVRLRVAVFVDGCFWHGCPKHASMPKANRAFWEAKLKENKERDARKDEALKALGWTPLHIWEHDDIDAAAERLTKAWRQGKLPSHPV